MNIIKPDAKVVLFSNEEAARVAMRWSLVRPNIVVCKESRAEFVAEIYGEVKIIYEESLLDAVQNKGIDTPAWRFYSTDTSYYSLGIKTALPLFFSGLTYWDDDVIMRKLWPEDNWHSRELMSTWPKGLIATCAANAVNWGFATCDAGAWRISETYGYYKFFQRFWSDSDLNDACERHPRYNAESRILDQLILGGWFKSTSSI